MWSNCLTILCGFLLSFYFGIGPSIAIQIEQQFPLGTIGCLFTDDVCGQNQPCIDDLLFGTCALEGMPRSFTYTLEENDLARLEQEMAKLIDTGFSWKDGYTQCIMQNVIVSLSIKEPFSKKICYDLIFDEGGPVENEIEEVLENLISRTAGLEGLALSREPSEVNYDNNAVDFVLPEQKRDEIVRVHKYFDKNEKIHKRIIPWEPQQDYANYLSSSALQYDPSTADLLPYTDPTQQQYVPSDSNYGNTNYANTNYADPDPRDVNIGWDAAEDLMPVANLLDLSDDDLIKIIKAEEEMAEQKAYQSKLAELFELLPSDLEKLEEFSEKYGNPAEVFSTDDLQPGFIWDGQDEIYGISQPGLEEDSISIEEPPMLDDMDALGDGGDVFSESDVYSLPPQFANTLDKLIRGEMDAENLTDEELNLLTPYVTKMLQSLNAAGGDEPMYPDAETMYYDSDGVDSEEVEDPSLWSQGAMENDMMRDDSSDETMQPFGVDEEDMMRMDPDVAEMLDNGATDSDSGVEDNGTELTDEDLQKQSQAVLEKIFFQKKSVGKGEDEPNNVKNEDVIDTNFVYIEMDHVLDEKNATKLIQALSTIVHANPDSLNRYIIVDNGNKLKIDVNPVLAGVNASTVAKLAGQQKLKLEEALPGYKFVGSGIGSQTEVALSNDNRYFVLTFVLCGCIAGILLAVVAIYLIRRNSRSKVKLQQITSAQEGNEAASKDYQDLCRQRMQSKSSEKPEPLHTAASRVSSVSESQVRSPSSRSSTSSCASTPVDRHAKKLSEEPVNSNMDISTGHIVLSYMEDHLKNKDRLDREWEAMCAYEADPASTKVAEDPANARKNRYADVLPYDHSRVVLATSTNVSGSDYINASTITDHDPRNPAYVATQGPLPHTVADFWQMVWEQGSVVIVMLSKLTETGESKCHRYWPEEGSDLYHIYEVHLVSEHIWCEDYLVRSFYLKNLQTGETRTVTQFHFLTWSDLGVPSSIKALLDFRRKVNKSYRGRSCPIMVHCSDGCGRTGTYSLIDMVLNRMAKGAKEIDIAATLEHIRDQRINMVKTKEQFQFALAAVAEEVHAILKALPQ